jgi:hypothetical protein
MPDEVGETYDSQMGDKKCVLNFGGKTIVEETAWRWRCRLGDNSVPRKSHRRGRNGD